MLSFIVTFWVSFDWDVDVNMCLQIKTIIIFISAINFTQFKAPNTILTMNIIAKNMNQSNWAIILENPTSVWHKIKLQRNYSKTKNWWERPKLRTQN